MFILPSRGTVELKHQDRHDGTWLSQERFAVVPANCAHETRGGLGGQSHVAIYVTDENLRKLDIEVGSLGEFRKRTRTTTLVERSPTLRALQRLIIRKDSGPYGTAAIRDAFASALVLQCISDVVTGNLLSNASHQDHGMALVDDIKSYLTEHADQEVPLDLLGEHFSISRRHITRLFRERTGLSIGAFQLQTKLKRARELLTETNLSVGDIAYRVGFESGAGLARAMRRQYGQSPSDVRQGMAQQVIT
ncbi:helix-turn-helix domain-containing protein [Brucella cytisi]|uniref:helix-turn-helix domain-containing protein n=1 Tax=Brucella cytisi TaxID=407152 RepID=UPI0035DF7EB6